MVESINGYDQKINRYDPSINYYERAKNNLQGVQGEDGIGTLGGLTTAGRVSGTSKVSTNNEYGISLPQNFSYVASNDGSKIATGQDGYGLAHRNPEDYNFHMIA